VKRDTLLVLSQVYVPDPASVGQHMADAAAEMARRGYRVVVIASARGYDDPTMRYKRRELLNGVEVRRLPLSSFGKRSILVRLAGQSFVLLQALVHGLQALVHGLLTRRLAGILVSTSPPMCSIVAVAISILRRAPVVYWAMDINPDQAVAMGKVRAGSLPVRAFDWINRRILGRAAAVVALDRFMGERLLRKLDISNKLEVMPPWYVKKYGDGSRPVSKAHVNGRTRPARKKPAARATTRRSAARR
jgi:hypothetical protein